MGTDTHHTTPAAAARRQAIVDYIAEHMQLWGHAPTVREIASALLIPSTSTVQRDLDWLRAHGAMSWLSGKPRTFKLNPAAGQIIAEDS